MIKQTTRGSAYYSNSSHKRAAMRATPLQVPASDYCAGVRLLITTTPENAMTLRGTSWCSLAGSCLCAMQGWSPPGYGNNYVGFRLAIYS